jgi:hypothetical protein
MEKFRGVPECVRNTLEGSGDRSGQGTLKGVGAPGVEAEKWYLNI